jgi:hypothetical protein
MQYQQQFPRPQGNTAQGDKQKGLPIADVPAICILDPDGDMVRRLRESGEAQPFKPWACYQLLRVRSPRDYG